MRIQYLILALIALLAGCSEITSNDDWSDFEDFVDREKSGGVLSCDSLVSTKMLRGSSGYNPRTWRVDILDFIHKNNYQFKQCNDEIKKSVSEYCARGVQKAIVGITNNVIGDGPSDRFEHHCENELKAELSKVNYAYKLPTPERNYIVIEKAGVMLRPNEVQRITFEEEISGLLWEISLHTNSDIIRLYYGRKDLYETAKSQLSKASS